MICVLAILTSIASLIASQLVIANISKVVTGDGRVLAAARQLQVAGLEDIAEADSFLLSGDVRRARAAGAASDKVRALAASLRHRLADSPSRKLLDEAVVAERVHRDAFSPSSSRDGRPVAAEAVAAGAVQMQAALTALVAQLESGGVPGRGATRSSVPRAEILLVAITIATVVLLILMCVMLIVALNRSYRLQTSARSQAEAGQSLARGMLSEAEAASHLKDEFLATVSHELRNPLAPILTWTQLLRSGTLDEEKTRKALEVIERNVRSQAQLIDDLVDVSSVASGKFRLDVRPIDLLPVIKAAAESQTPASDAKQIRLQLVLDERAGLISGDSERLQQVMWNLISNAIKFTPRGGSVQVVLQRVESHLEITVTDSGVGIEAAFLPNVFEPFRQAVGGTMRRHGGLGLGLSIVHTIVELHGGEISATSPGLNRGTRFLVKFPLLATAAAPEPAATPRRHPIARDASGEVRFGRLDGIRVLVVEDEPSAREALQILLATCGAETRVAASAGEALATLDTWQPDVLVSDIAMPGEDGYSLLRELRRRPPERGGLVPAVALTAYAKIEDRVTILAAGFHMYVSKPADPHELIAVVRSLAGRMGAATSSPKA